MSRSHQTKTKWFLTKERKFTESSNLTEIFSEAWIGDTISRLEGQSSRSQGDRLCVESRHVTYTAKPKNGKRCRDFYVPDNNQSIRSFIRECAV